MSFDEELWWEELDEFFTDFAIEAGLEEENYLEAKTTFGAR